MTPSRRFQALLIGFLLVLVVVAFVYQFGMARLEGKPRGFWESLTWAAETLSTTGYGADSRWTHPAMVLLVAAVQFVGVFLVFLVVPIYLIPFLEERFERRIPKAVPPTVGHVVVWRYGPAVESLLEQLRESRVPAVVAEMEEMPARRVMERGFPVVLGRPGDRLLEQVRLAQARALVVNGGDADNAAVILAARHAGFAGEILAVAEDPRHRRPLRLAGATVVFTPRHILAAALAARASHRISPRVAGVQQLGRSLRVAEVHLEAGSPLVGLTLNEAGVGARTGASVIGRWVGGRLEPEPGPQTRLAAGDVLVVAGGPGSLERLAERCAGALALRRPGPFLILGYGEVGRKVVELLREVGEEARVIDRGAADGVDRVGDVLDPKVLEEAGAPDCQAAILALDSDSATLFAAVILRDLAPGLPVIARVNEAENVETIHAAGATFALSISQVSGQMLARRLLGEEAISLDAQLRLTRVGSRGLAGRRPAELRIRERTGCSVVAVERGDELLVELGSDTFRFADGDRVYLCGSREAARRFAAVFPQA